MTSPEPSAQLLSTRNSDISAEMFETADEFLDMLAPRHPDWEPDPEEWVFRGHADAQWQLLPNALREDVRLGFRHGTPAGPRPTHAEQVGAEISMLFSFLTTADTTGLTLPPAAESIWNAAGSKIENFIANAQRAPLRDDDGWPHREWIPLLALAQHYGIPTRLLDWTSQARVAAYFAAERAARWARRPDGPPSGATHLDLWGVRTGPAQYLTRKTTSGPRIEFRSVLRSWNPNLHAQHGVLSVVLDPQARMGSAPIRTPLDQIVKASLLAENTIDGLHVTLDDAPMRRLSLPLAEAPRLLRLLSMEGVTAATIYPGYAGAAATLEDRRFFDL